MLVKAQVKHILIIDDDKVCNYYYAHLLRKMSDQDRVSTCVTGYEALVYLEEKEKKSDFPDLILLDINMPVMDGFSFLKTYAQSYYPQHPLTVVAIVTSDPSENSRLKTAEYPFVHHFLNKPLTEDQLWWIS